MINFFKKYWLFITINVAVLLILVFLFMIVRRFPQEGGVIYQFN